jgi:hypothetical protein
MLVSEDFRSDKYVFIYTVDAVGNERMVCNSRNLSVNTLTPNDLYRRRPVSPLKIKIPSKSMREKPTNTPIIHSVY